jgi:hypothetical protein
VTVICTSTQNSLWDVRRRIGSKTHDPEQRLSRIGCQGEQWSFSTEHTASPPRIYHVVHLRQMLHETESQVSSRWLHLTHCGGTEKGGQKRAPLASGPQMTFPSTTLGLDLDVPKSAHFLVFWAEGCLVGLRHRGGSLVARQVGRIAAVSLHLSYSPP